MQTFIQLGEYGEHQIVMERVVALEGLMDQVGGHLRLKDGKPRFVGTRIGLDNGTYQAVPQTPDEVLARFMQAADAQMGQ